MSTKQQVKQDGFEGWAADQGEPATTLVDGFEVVSETNTEKFVADVLATVTGPTPQAVDRAFKSAWETLTLNGDRRPERAIEERLCEQQRKAHEALVTRTHRKSSGERKPKGEFPPIAMRTLDWLASRDPLCGPDRTGFSVQEITEGMGEKYTGTVWHGVKRLVEARRVRPMPDNAKRFSLFPPAGPISV